MTQNNQFGLYIPKRGIWLTDKHFVRRTGSRQEMEFLRRAMEKNNAGLAYEVRPISGSMETK